MGEYVEIIEKLNVYISVEEKNAVEKKLNIGDRTFIQVRDLIVGMGKILEEDFEKQIYIITIMAGIANMNTAFVGLQLKNNILSLVGYAKEGLIKQHTAEKAIAKLEKVVN